MKFSSLVLAAAALPVMTSAYDPGCLYPEAMPEPFDARYLMHVYAGSYLMASKVETPVVIHSAAMSAYCQSNCVAYHDADMLNVLTMEPPIVRSPPEYHNSWSRMLCIAQCHSILADEAGRPGFFQHYFDEWGLYDIKTRNDGIGLAWLSSQDDPTILEDMLAEADWHPFVVGQVVATEILLSVDEDGWNARGAWEYDKFTGGKIRCTANCQHYKDTYGYFPVNIESGKAETNVTKYEVEGTDRHWQPLFDSDNQGYFSAQLHVTPHIGFHAKTHLFDSVDDIPQTPDPQYNYREEALGVVERLRETASDPIKKQKIAFFDNKLLVINLVENHLKANYQDKYTFEEEILYIEGMSAAELEATVMAWREKVRHDLVRPTTVIKRWGDDKLFTFGGDKSLNEPVEIAARDFEAFQRVMPHSEYPSGSSCICTGYSEFTDAFTSKYYNETLKNIRFTGFGCDGSFLHSSGCDSNFTIADMPALLEECSQSRLWAGFHFPAATSAAEAMCKGVGLMAFDHHVKVRNGSTFGQPYHRGEPKPACNDPSYVPPTKAPSMMVEEGPDVTELFQSAATSPWKMLVVTAVPLLAFFAL